MSQSSLYLTRIVNGSFCFLLREKMGNNIRTPDTEMGITMAESHAHGFSVCQAPYLMHESCRSARMELTPIDDSGVLNHACDKQRSEPSHENMCRLELEEDNLLQSWLMHLHVSGIPPMNRIGIPPVQKFRRRLSIFIFPVFFSFLNFRPSIFIMNRSSDNQVLQELEFRVNLN